MTLRMRRLRVRTRWQASALHLGLSALIAAAGLAVMLAVWYPRPLFEAAGGNELLFLLVGVDIVIGPLITLVIFRLGKPGLKFDLVAIGVLQLAALAYGGHVVYLARPAFLVFVKDRFEVVTAVELEPEELARARYPQFRQPPLGGPMLAYADMPSDPQEMQQVINDALAGRDMQNFPKFFVPYAQRTKQVLGAAMTLERLRTTEPGYAKVVEGYLAKEGLDGSGLRYCLLRARRAWVVVLLDPRTGYPIKMLIVEKI